MCFTISYGLLHFPEAGILDAAQQTSSTTDSQSFQVMKQTADGTSIQVEETSFSTALPETQTPNKDLFDSQSNSTPTSDSTNSENASSAEKDSQKPTDNASAAKSPKTKTESKPKKAKSDVAKQSAKENKQPAKENKQPDEENKQPVPESKPEKTESDAVQQPAAESNQPDPENKPNNQTEEQDDSQFFIEAPSDDDFIPDESLPIESDINPMPPMVDTTESDIPPIIVDDNISLTEQNVGPITEPDIQEEEPIQVPEMPEDDSQTVKDLWKNYISEDSPSKNLESNNNNTPIDSNSPFEADQKPVLPEPPVIQSDPNAQEIPPRNREKALPNKDAFTKPAINEQQNNVPNPNRPNTGTIPLETFPIDSAANDPATTQRINYTVDCQQEPYDPFGFKVPIIGPIVVRRLPSVDNSVDPIYNNAQLDRFAL